ncbi:putative efflux transporter [Calocera viscosa TUFC12733]|uniref:Putative efflux transporter n=1 Tax=Calocera viscosa (strain TUFC12733) TaxID=1330018 RepID=A0A167FWE7_CALVF|nr:putative efflux transporter [Calocera viscosa TUFC12733]
MLILGSTCLTMVVYIASINSMFIILPTVGRDLTINPASLQWIVTAYALTSGCFLLLFGRLADIFGRKLIFLSGCIWFIGFTLGCGFSRTGLELIIMRALTGIGGAAMIPACLGILAHTFPPSHARTIAFSTFQAAAPCGGVLGTVVGGVVTQFASVSWRALFYVLAGVASLVLAGAIICFPNDRVDKSADKRVDWLGAFLITAGLVLLLFCLGEGEIAPQQWGTPYIIALLILSVVLIAAFIGWEHYVETRLTFPPLMKLDLFARGKWKFSAILLISFLVNGAFISWQYWATQYYQNYWLVTPTYTVLFFLPMFFVGFTLLILVVFGCTMTSLASLLFAVIDPNAMYWAFGFPAAILDVVGADIIMSGGSLVCSHLALPEEQSLAGGLFNTVTQIGISFATTISTIVYDRVVRSRSAADGVLLDQYASNAPPDALLQGYRSAQWTNFAFAIFGALVGTIVLRGIGRIGGKHTDHDKQNEQATSGPA